MRAVYLVAIAAYVACMSMAVELRARRARQYWRRSVTAALHGFVATVPLYLFVRYVAERTGAPPPVLGGGSAFGLGVLLGGTGVTVSAVSYRLHFHVDIVERQFWKDVGWRIVSNSSPALLEEVGLRGGITGRSVPIPETARWDGGLRSEACSAPRTDLLANPPSVRRRPPPCGGGGQPLDPPRTCG